MVCIPKTAAVKVYIALGSARKCLILWYDTHLEPVQLLLMKDISIIFSIKSRYLKLILHSIENRFNWLNAQFRNRPVFLCHGLHLWINSAAIVKELKWEREKGRKSEYSVAMKSHSRECPKKSVCYSNEWQRW